MNNKRLESLLQFLKEDPNDAFTLYAIATEYKNTDRNKALQYFDKLLLEHPHYVGTYYHAAKLLDQIGNKEKAKSVFEKGMLIAQEQSNFHALAELRQAYNQMMGLDYEDEV